MKKHLPGIFLAAYVIAGIVTFGRAYVNAPEPRSQYVSKQELSMYAAIGAAIGWPMYWSIVAWEKP